MAASGAKWKSNLIRKARTVQKRVLYMPDDVYQGMLLERYGKGSTRDLNLKELKDLVSHLDATSGNKQQASMPDAQARKIWVLWLKLHEIGAVRDKSERALNAFVKRQTKVESYRWLNRYQASDVIEALKKWQKRARKS